MGTEKSLLTFTEEMFPKVEVGNSLQFPVGILPSGKPEVVELSRNLGTAHACVIGRCGSGKTKYVEFVIKALHSMYGDNITVHYLDGKGGEYPYWLKYEPLNKGLIRDGSTQEKLVDALQEITALVDSKNSTNPEIVVVDDISHHIDVHADKIKYLLHMLFVTGAQKNVTMLYATQNPVGNLRSIAETFGLAATTNVNEDISNDVYGSVVGSSKAGVRRFGDLVYSYRGFTSRVRIPFCTQH